VFQSFLDKVNVESKDWKITLRHLQLHQEDVCDHAPRHIHKAFLEKFIVWQLTNNVCLWFHLVFVHFLTRTASEKLLNYRCSKFTLSFVTPSRKMSESLWNKLTRCFAKKLFVGTRYTNQNMVLYVYNNFCTMFLLLSKIWERRIFRPLVLWP